MIRVMLVDDHASFRDGLAFVIGHDEDITIVAQAGSLAEARATVATTGVDVVLVDLELPDGSGLDLLPDILGPEQEAAVIVLTGSIRPESRALAVADGAVGFLRKTTGVSEIVQAIRQVAGGQPLIAPSEALTLMRQANQYRAQVEANQRVLQSLTPRERDVLRALAAGLDNQGIADRLHLSTATVRTHVVQLLRKMEVTSRLQAALLAVRLGMIDGDDLG